MRKNDERGRVSPSKIFKILFIVALVGIVVLIISNRATLEETWSLLKTLDVKILLLLPLIQLINFYFLANYYRSFFDALGHKLPLKTAYESVSALGFVNQILPSGGLSGLSYLGYGWRHIAPFGTITAVQLGRYVMSFASYVLIILISFIFLLVANDVNKTVWLVFGVLSIATIIGALIFKIIISGKKQIDSFAKSVCNVINKLASTFSEKHRQIPLLKKAVITKVLNDFHKKIESVMAEKKRVFWPGLFMFLSTTMEMLIVYVSFLAIGVAVNPGIIILAFAAANVAGVVSVIPGDVGIHEFSMIFVLSVFGVDEAAAISATLLYRVFNKMIFLPIGFFFYSTILKPPSKQRLKSGISNI